MIVDNLDKFADKFKLKSPRLSNWDYSTPGYYFVTICTYNHNNFFGKIINNQIELSKIGNITNQCLTDIPKHFNNISIDEYIVMPNHVHILFHVETPYMASLNNQSKQIINSKQPECDSVETHHDASQNTKSKQIINSKQSKYNSNETPYMASLQYNRKITLINYSHKNHPDYYSRLNQKSKQLIPKAIQQFKSSVKRICNQNNLFFSWQSRYFDQIIKDKKEYLIIKQYIQNNVINWQKDIFYKE